MPRKWHFAKTANHPKIRHTKERANAPPTDRQLGAMLALIQTSRFRPIADIRMTSYPAEKVLFLRLRRDGGLAAQTMELDLMLSTILGLILLIAIPVEALWRTRRDRPPKTRLARYQTTIMRAAILMGLLLLAAYTENVSAAELGLGLKLDTAGLIGLGVAAIVCLGLGISTAMAKPTKQGLRSSETDILKPEDWRERGYFVGFVLVIGFAWELLYRGFLLWWLVPLVGVSVAVLLSGISYGLAHGWKNSRQGLGSIVSALLFATGYALTGSLWWLIIIHIALPVVGFAALRKQQSNLEGHERESLSGPESSVEERIAKEPRSMNE